MKALPAGSGNDAETGGVTVNSSAPAEPAVGGSIVRRVTAALALLAVAVWMGGLLALGALAAPAVFGTVPLPLSADAMTLVFQRFDLVATACAAIVLATEAAAMMARLQYRSVDRARGVVSVVAAVLAVLQGVRISPRIAELHAGGALRGAGPAGRELAHLHDLAEACGQAQLVLLAAAVVLHVVALSTPEGRGRRSRRLVA
jgi:putative copper export protein